MKLPKVAIIILNWNGWEDTIECLESVYQNNYPNYDVIVIDNASNDDSVKKIKEYADGKIKIQSKYISFKESNKPIEVYEYKLDGIASVKNNQIESSNNKLNLIINDKNYGFAEGNNVGIRFALNTLNSDYILLLNNDTVVAKEFLVELVHGLEDNPNVGILGSKIYDYWQKNIVQSSGGNINWLLGKIYTYENYIDKEEDVCERDFVWATSSIVRKEVFECIGLLDPYFFFGIEEYDLCSRAKKAGFRIMYFPKSCIWHKKKSSAKKLVQYPEVKKIIYKQRGFLCYKHYHRLYKKNLPPFIYMFPLCLHMGRWIFEISMLFLKYLLSGNIQKIKTGYQNLR